MRYKLLFFFVFILAACSPEAVKKNATEALANFQNFEVMTLFTFYDQINQTVIYESIVESFKNFGKVTVSEEPSMFQTFPKLSPSLPICMVSIGKTPGQLEVSLEIFAQAAIIANQYKTLCSIWKKKLYIFQEAPQVGEEVINMIKKLIEDFAKDYSRANPEKTVPSFYVRKFNGF